MMRPRPLPANYSVTPPRTRRRYAGTVASFLAHLLLIALLFLTVDHDFATAVDRGATLSPLRGGGGGGGGGVQFVALPEPPHPAAAAPKPVVRTTEPQAVPVVTKTPETIPPPVEPRPAEPAPSAGPPAPTAGDAGPGTGGGTGGGTGTGNGPGTGPGNGPGDGGGRGKGSRLRNTTLVPLGDTPKQLRGDTLRFLFTVGSDGHPVKIEIIPEISDRGLREKLLQTLRDWRFLPSRDSNGVAITDTVTITQVFGT
jgi:hypothetical protein